MFFHVVGSIISFHEPGDKRRVGSFAGAACFPRASAKQVIEQMPPALEVRVKAAPLQASAAPILLTPGF
jgi:hypothetical protein